MPEPPVQLIGDLVDPGLGARLVLVAAGRTGNADRADDVVADFDRSAPCKAMTSGKCTRPSVGLSLTAWRSRPKGRAVVHSPAACQALE